MKRELRLTYDFESTGTGKADAGDDRKYDTGPRNKGQKTGGPACSWPAFFLSATWPTPRGSV
jgi:hypothetical protein